MENMWILAQNAGDEGGPGITSAPVGEEGDAGTIAQTPADVNNGSGGKSPSSPFNWIFLPVMLIIVFMMFRGPQKQKKQHRKMVQTLQKNDRIRTIGGIIGTVVDIKEDEVTLKIDEANNTKMKIASSAIGKNLSKES